VKAYLNDPEARTMREIVFVDERKALDEMYRLIGADTLDHQIISDEHDSIWLDGDGLRRGEPIYAFKLPIQREPYAGKALVIGADDYGQTRAPFIPIEMLRRDVEWLGRIMPEVVWEKTAFGERAIVTYARVKD
jgi:hypothetical protein